MLTPSRLPGGFPRRHRHRARPRRRPLNGWRALPGGGETEATLFPPQRLAPGGNCPCVLPRLRAADCPAGERVWNHDRMREMQHPVRPLQSLRLAYGLPTADHRSDRRDTPRARPGCRGRRDRGGSDNAEAVETGGGIDPYESSASSIDTLLGSGQKKHSGLGMASFIIALLVGGLDVVLGLIVVSNVVNSKGVERVKESMLGGAMSLVCLNFLSLPACLVGIGLAFVGLVAHRDRNHLFTVIGLVGNGLVILGVLALILWSSTSSH